MKSLICSILILIPLNSLGQEFGLNKGTNLLTYEEVLIVDSLEADDIYSKVKEWILLTFKNSVIVGDNKPTLLMVKYVRKYFSGVIYRDFYSSMTIKIKDEAVKVIIDDVRQKTPGWNIESYIFKKDGTLKKGKGYTRAFFETEVMCKEFTQSLGDYLIKEDDW